MHRCGKGARRGLIHGMLSEWKFGEKGRAPELDRIALYAICGSAGYLQILFRSVCSACAVSVFLLENGESDDSLARIKEQEIHMSLARLLVADYSS